ncbi:unnamed protein product [Mycena citricolor]|uniref:Heme haloperoxidase family profile domain-containing protein n=1 Tax=Mycena citricolor TaxID=2018698 RepID=A0AAD2JZQ3_9AGAR|nr:unnamed protein product [Mycena citricolor]
MSAPASTSACSKHAFITAAGTDQRAPCPALNTLANHGYISHDGGNLHFTAVLQAVRCVYNLSLPLAFLLTFTGFITCGSFRLDWRALTCSWTLSLADLSARGGSKITHDASLVHPSHGTSHAPDRSLVADLLARARVRCGLTLPELAAVHSARISTLSHPLSLFHEQVALGECALAWLVLQDRNTGVIETQTLEQWFGEERLPLGWWDATRPVNSIGLLKARRTATEIGRLADTKKNRTI